MAINIKKYINHIKELEDYYASNPGLYKFKLLLIGFLGYFYIFAVLGLISLGMLLLVVLAIISKKILIIILMIINFVVLIKLSLVAFRIKIPLPEGIELKKEDAPVFYSIMNELSKEINSPKIDKIIFDYRYNCGILQVPRLGILGFPKNYLLVGLPYMQSLSKGQFKSVLVHELAHISRSHGLVNNYVYNLKTTWTNLVESLEYNEHFSAVLFKGFMNWYVPYFSAYSFVLLRNHEYEADKTSANLVGKKDCGDAFMNLIVGYECIYKKYWEEFNKGMINNSKPPKTAITELMKELRLRVDKDQMDKAITIALNEQDHYNDEHPCLYERLASIAYKPEIPEVNRVSAAEALLGDYCYSLVDKLNKLYYDEALGLWEYENACFNEDKKVLEALKVKADKNELSIEEAWELATKVQLLNGDESSIDLYRVVLEYNPDHSKANYALGAILLEINDESGISYMKKAINSHYEFAIPGYNCIYDYYLKNNLREEAEKLKDKILDRINLENIAREEFEVPFYKAKYKSHSLDSKFIESLRQEFKKYDAIKNVYLAQRDIKTIPEMGYYVLAFDIRFPFTMIFTNKTKEGLKIFEKISSNEELVKDIEYDLFWLYLNIPENKPIQNKLKKVKGALVYHK